MHTCDVFRWIILCSVGCPSLLSTQEIALDVQDQLLYKEILFSMKYTGVYEGLFPLSLEWVERSPSNAGRAGLSLQCEPSTLPTPPPHSPSDLLFLS